MKLVRFGAIGEEKPGLVDRGGRIRSLERVVSDIGPKEVSPAGQAALRNIDPETLPLAPEGSRIGAPLGNIGKIVAVGLNYRKHAEEAGLEPPKEPSIFLKVPSSVAGSDGRSSSRPSSAARRSR